jgi:hypothetical protein
MNNDYLWDRTGEPDAEVQELEEVLGTLRFQPRPFELPVNAQSTPRRRIFPALAIAAMIALMVLAAGVWLRVQRQRRPQPGEIAKTGKESDHDKAVPIAAPPRPGTRDESNRLPRDQEIVIATLPSRAPVRIRNARHTNKIKPSVPHDEMSPSEIAEAEVARDQLMLALRVVSAKLSLAQRKTVPTTNNIRYQHKVG